MLERVIPVCAFVMTLSVIEIDPSGKENRYWNVAVVVALAAPRRVNVLASTSELTTKELDEPTVAVGLPVNGVVLGEVEA
jgi:hypothetical protein